MIKVNISNGFEYGGRAIRIKDKRSEGYYRGILELKFEPVKLGEFISPSLVLDEDIAEDLLHAFAQGLAEAGYLPKVYQDKDNELKATKYHLEDMRKLALKDIK
jgi:hypothetical protein